MLKNVKSRESEDLINSLEARGIEVIGCETIKWASYWWADFITVRYKDKLIAFANAKEIYKYGTAVFSNISTEEALYKIKNNYKRIFGGCKNEGYL